MNLKKKVAFIFPGQGAQTPGMGKDFYHEYPTARHVFEEADDILHQKLSHIIFDGAEAILTETRHSQPAIYVTSLAILKVLHHLVPNCVPVACAGLSLGEYTALTASQHIDFSHCLPLVQHRAKFMHETCETTKGTMAVILGLENNQVIDLVQKLNLPRDLWVANFNCPGQVVISGTIKGVEAGCQAAYAAGAKKTIPLQVHGAFHSGLMNEAQTKLAPFVHNAHMKQATTQVAMNVTGGIVENLEKIRELLIEQVTKSVFWQKDIESIEALGIDLFVEIGPGKTLAGMNKRIGVKVPTISIEKIPDIALFENAIKTISA